ncbi:MAG: TonB-dependent receptor plug domain-containing protein [Opitutales bacterium]|nr:TonB-dependent receptor plug domain-containing protein [Opitutales bacterium]
MPKKLLKRSRMLASLLVLGAPMWAQDDAEEVYELSPFSVSSEDTVGYLAGNTLAGTRLKSQLKDLASAVQVVTEEFLEDTGATDFGELLTYTTGTEASGVSGNSSFGEFGGGTNRMERSRREPQLNTRVRGLARADLTRDYFLSDIAFDPYNTSEVTINRGPNASLFGLGSPGGIVNSAIDEAQTHRNFGELNFKWDEFGTLRTSLNYNKVLLEDKLALRVAFLDSDKKYEQNQAFYDEERYFVAATWRPFENTIIRANYEEGDAFGSRPNLAPPTDRISGWFANGKPSYNPVTKEWFHNGALVTDTEYINQLSRATTQLASQVANGNPVSVFDDPNSPIAGSKGGYAAMQAGVRSDMAGRTEDSFPVLGTTYMRMWNSVKSQYGLDPNYIVGARPEIPTSHLGFYQNPSITDRNVIDYRSNSLTGPTSIHEQSFNAEKLSIEKTWLDDKVGIELSYSDQYWRANLSEATSASSANTLNVDINTVLMDGSTNPNYGRPFIGGRGYTQSTVRHREAFQAIGFANYDFEEEMGDGWMKHLGKHTLTVVAQDQKFSNTAPNRMYAKADSTFSVNLARGGPGLDAANAAGLSSRSPSTTRNTMLQYLGSSLVNASSLDSSDIQGVTAVQVPVSTDNALVWNPYNSQFEEGSVAWNTYRNNPSQVWVWGNPRSQEGIESKSAILQSHFLGGNVVTTASWRSDSVTQATGAQVADPVTGLYPPDLPEVGDPFIDVSESQASYGVVGHAPDEWMPEGLGLSVHYVDSSNFAAGAAGRNIFNEAAPFQTGVTEEYGFSVTALDQKLHLRVNKFDSSQANSKITGTIPNPFGIIGNVMNYNTPEALAAAGWNLDTIFKPGFLESANFRQEPDGMWMADNIAGTSTNIYQDTVTEGTEIELSYAPTKNWRWHFNAASAEVQVSNVMTDLAAENKRIVAEVFNDSKMGNLFTVSDPYLTDGSINPEAILSYRSSGLLSSTAQKTSPEGGTLQELRKWRWNLLTNYTFDGDSGPEWLSGFGVGTGLRWQDKAIIGTALKQVEGVTVPDHDTQYFGSEELNVDAWVTYDTKVFDGHDLRLQARIRNLTSDDDLIPVRANPDGSVALYRIGAPTWLELSARLKF